MNKYLPCLAQIIVSRLIAQQSYQFTRMLHDARDAISSGALGRSAQGKRAFTRATRPSRELAVVM